MPLSKMSSYTVGLAPKGKVQFANTVLLPVWPVKVTKLNTTLLQPSTAKPPSKLTVPPLALKTGEPVIVSPPLKLIVPDGALKVPPEITRLQSRSAPDGRDKLPELRVQVPWVEVKVLYELRSTVAPATVIDLTFKPVKPDRLEPEFMVKGDPVDTVVKVPVPLKVPFRITWPEVPLPIVPIVGLFPSGRLQFELIVLVLLL